MGYQEGFYYRPRIDLELLSRNSEGLIGLSACLKGIVAWNINQNNYAEAKKQAGRLSDVLGKGNFYLEIQDHGIEEQKQANPEILKLAKELDLPLVATNDCHYLNPQDSFSHDVLLCVQTGRKVDDVNRLSYRSDQFFFKTAQQMQKLFGHVPKSISNTLEIAEKCNFELGATKNVFPDFDVPKGSTVDDYFEQVVRKGFDRRLEVLSQLEKDGRLRHPLEEYRSRLDDEIRMIQRMQFPGYFLIVWDFMRYAREQGIAVGPGRGSAAGSLVSYALQITDVDPLAYDLLFERFLNPERITPPDIDIDFCMRRRSEVIDYVTHKYGRDNVSQIITFGTMAARGAIRDVGRALDIPYSEVDKIAKLVPQEPNATLTKALKSVKELKEISKSEEKYKKLISVARNLEGLARHASTHAAGVVIAPKPLIELIPLYKSSKDEIMTQFSMSDLERLGLLKMDFLALTTLTVIEQALDQITTQLGETLDVSLIDLKDEQTFLLFSEGRTTGIFQFESSGMRDILRRLQPDRFEDLIALNALYRPGPIKGGMIDDFILRRHGKVDITYELPELEEILHETYGVILYQEQVMQIASKLGGFSLAEADLLRRAMGKKKKEVMAKQREQFLKGAKEGGFDKSKATRIFELMEKFAGYGFNKSHSTAYALLAYQTAFLKAHYPVQFMAAMLTSEMSNTDKIVKYLAECKEMGISVQPPDINASQLQFHASGKGILFGLAATKNVGESAIQRVLECRDEIGRFSNFYEFCESVDLRHVNKRVLEALIKAGAFDSLGHHRKSLMEILDKAIERGQNAQRDRLSGQKGLFALAGDEGEGVPPEKVPDLGEWGDREKWSYEKETLGFYVSGHPLEKYEHELKQFSQVTAAEIDEEISGKDISIGGVVTGLRKLRTRKGDSMAAFELEDLTGTVEVVVWPKAYQQHFGLLEGSEIPLLIRGRCEVDGRGEARILCNEITPFNQLWKQAVHKACISITVSSIEDDKLNKLQLLLRRYPGRCPVEFELSKPDEFRLRLVPTAHLQINPVPDLIQEVEGLFGEKSVRLYT
jgi:DNA polymerase-3 subunit alpha